MSRNRRAGRYNRTLTPSQAQVYRDDPKVAVSAEVLVWQDPDGPVPFLKFAVECGAQRLIVQGRDRGVGNVQIWLEVPEVRGMLARLCWTPQHGDDVHWHWYDQMEGLDEGDTLSVRLDPPTRGAMLDQFLRRLRIEVPVVQEEIRTA